jgi:hypothetical protein
MTFLRHVKLRSMEAEQEVALACATTFQADLPSSATKRRKAGEKKDEILKGNADRKAALKAQRQKKAEEDEAVQSQFQYWHAQPRRSQLVKDMFDDVKDPLRKKPAK